MILQVDPGNALIKKDGSYSLHNYWTYEKKVALWKNILFIEVHPKI